MTTRPNAVLVLNPPGANQGFLLPQLTTASRNAIHPSSPEEDGLLVFDINQKEFYYWKNSQWIKGLGSDQSLSFDPDTRKLTLSDGNTIDLSHLEEIPDQTENSGKFLTTNGTTTSWTTLIPGVATPTLQSYSIDPSDFSGLRTSSKKDKANALIFEDNTTFVTVFKQDEGSRVIAPIHLPDGATIQQIQFYYMDRDGQNLSLSIMRRPYMGNNENIITTWNSSGVSPAIQMSTHTPIAGREVIDNTAYSYRIVVDLDPSSDANDSNDATHRVYGLQVKYVR